MIDFIHGRPAKTGSPVLSFYRRRRGPIVSGRIGGWWWGDLQLVKGNT